MDFDNQSPSAVFAGKLQRDFVVTPDKKMHLDVLGGNVIYAAVGYKVWQESPPPGILARVGEDFPKSWLDDCKKRGFDIRGVKVLPGALDLRNFYVYTSLRERAHLDPVAYFGKVGQPFPRALLGYRPNRKSLDSKVDLEDTSIRQSDIPEPYMDATAVHMCPMDYLTHSLLPAVFRQAGFTTVTLDPAESYMNPTFFSDVPSLVTGLTAFLPSEEELRSLFAGRSEDLWEMVEELASYGCEIIVVKRGVRGQYLYDAAAKKRYEITAYDSRMVDPTGVGDAFCGGFLAGFRKTFDPVEAALYGNISASLTTEGVGVFYALDALPGLAEARLDALRPNVLAL